MEDSHVSSYITSAGWGAGLVGEAPAPSRGGRHWSGRTELNCRHECPRLGCLRYTTPRNGGTERTRTVIDLIDNQVPHLSATVPCEIGSACRIRTDVRLIEARWLKPLGEITMARQKFGWAYNPHMQMKIRYAKKQMKAARTMSRTHFETHFSRGWRSLGLSQSTEIVIRLKAPAFISRKKVLRLSKNKRSGPLASQGSCPLLTILANFSLELGAGVRSR